MKGYEIKLILEDAAKELGSLVSGSIELDSDLSIYKGITIHNAFYLQFRIGTYDVDCHPNKNFKDEIAMIPIVGLFHEVCGHGGQINYEFYQDSDLSKLLGLNYYACKGSGAYYDGCAEDGKFSEQYAKQPYEIAAQYMGLKSARTYLTQIWGSEETDKMLLKYVNYRVRHKSEFIDKADYKTIEDVFDAFEDAFIRNIHAHREYDFEKGRQCDDCLSRYPLLNDSMIQNLVNCNDGAQQDFVMASLFCHDHPHNERLFEGTAFSEALMPVSEAFEKMKACEIRIRAEHSTLEELRDMSIEINKVGPEL